MPTRRRALLLLALLALLAGVSLLWALMAGTLPVAPRDALGALLGQDQGTAGEVVRSLRLPRALAAFACGGPIVKVLTVPPYFSLRTKDISRL